MLHSYRAGAGLPISSHAGQTDADKMSFSRMVDQMQDEGRIRLTGKTRAHVARLTDRREAELLELAGLPSMATVFQCMAALSATKSKGIGEGWQLIIDHKDQAADLLRCANVQFALVPAVLRGWMDWMPSMQLGFVFARLTDAGKEALKMPYERDELEKDDSIAIAFDDAMEDARDSLKALRPGSSQNIGDQPVPFSFGTKPRQTVFRMLAGITLPEYLYQSNVFF
jgi:hypothetical protein